MFLLLLFLPLISCINKYMCVCVFAVQELGPSPVQCFPTTTCDLNEIAALFAACAMKISLAQPSAEMWQKRWCLSIRDCKTENYLGDACIPKHTKKMCIASSGAGVPRRRLLLEARLKFFCCPHLCWWVQYGFNSKPNLLAAQGLVVGVKTKRLGQQWNNIRHANYRWSEELKTKNRREKVHQTRLEDRRRPQQAEGGPAYVPGGVLRPLAAVQLDGEYLILCCCCWIQ